MNAYLLDTNVISDFAKSRPSANLASWIADQDESNLFLSVITIGELRFGIDCLPSGAKRNKFERYLGDVQARFHGRILPIDEATAECWGRIAATARKQGVTLPTADALIAATSIQNAVVVATGNTDHFQRAGATVVNPFEG